jgi:hypothetical protein
MVRLRARRRVPSSVDRVLIAIVLVGVHLALSVERSIDVALVALAATVGAVVETVQIGAGTYRFTSGTLTEGRPAAHSRSSRVSGWVRSPSSRRSRTACSAAPSAGRSPCSSSPRRCDGWRRNGTYLSMDRSLSEGSAPAQRQSWTSRSGLSAAGSRARRWRPVWGLLRLDQG